MKRLLILLILFSSVVTVSAQDKLSAEQIDTISRTVVDIAGVDGRDVIPLGSGIIISPDGRIYTNQHVTDGFDEFIISILDDPNELPVATYLASVAKTYPEDFAELQIDALVDGSRLPNDFSLNYLEPIAANVQRGDDIFIFGYPSLGDGYLVLTQGTITTVQNGTVGDVRMPVLYQTDAEISPGNSGGLAINMRGEIVGLPTFVNSEDRTNGRLGGILPFGYLLVLAETGESAVRDNPNDSTNPQDENFFRNDDAGNVAQCDDGRTIENGLGIFVYLALGNTYTITAVGVDNFDPIIAVTQTNSEEGYRCSQDKIDVPTLSLPTVRSNSRDEATELTFKSESDATLIVVGDSDQNDGELFITIEGLRTDEGDVGTIFLFLPSQSMLRTPESLTVYVIGVERPFDPLLYLYDSEADEPQTDNDNVAVVCDDSGLPNSCWGRSRDLSGSFLETRNGRISADDLDAMLPLTSDLIEFSGVPLVVSSSRSGGDYISVFHIRMR